MNTAATLGPYIREINVIANSMIRETDSYARYRAIGEGFKHNVGWLKDTSPPSISFFNGVTAMLDLALVMSTWKITEPLMQKEDKYLPGEIYAAKAASKRRSHDEIRSLPRLAFLFRTAFQEGPDSYGVRYAERQSEIIAQHGLPPRDMAEYSHKIAEDRDLLLSYCDRVDTLVSSDIRMKLDLVRNQGFAHSAAISRKTITANIVPEEMDFPRTMLFSFGDEIMQLARDFEAVWFQRSRASVKDLIKQSVVTGDEFWQGAKKGLA